MKIPGEAIREELERREWTQSDLARIIDRPLPTINEIIVGKRAIMPDMAKALGVAFGNGAEFWTRLEADYRLSLSNADVSPIARRVLLFELGPIKEMERRGWIKSGNDTAELESELCRFFGIENADQEPQITVATRKSMSVDPMTPAQRAWCFRAKQMAMAVHAELFKPELLDHCQGRLRELAAFPEEARNVAKVLAGFGIRFVIVEPLNGSKIDGAAFWLTPKQPVIALSIRFDRLDSFWFTLAHEFEHIKNGDASIDTALVGDDSIPSQSKDEIEQRADAEAANMLIPKDKLDSFVLRVGPLYSKTRINQFAIRMRIHPAVVVGQLQHRGELGYSSNREMLAKIRSFVIETALTDGWGKTLSLI